MKAEKNGELKIFSGRANSILATQIVTALAKNLNRNVALGEMAAKNFSDGEIWVKYEENIRGCDVFLIQPTNPPADNLMELLIMIDAARRASARRITAVIPYFGYARQDRKDQPRVAISGKLMANLITQAGADRVLTIELHAPQIQGFFDIPLDHLYTGTVLIDKIKKMKIPDLTVAAPDIGSVLLGRSYARRLRAKLAIINKDRTAHNKCKVDCIIGEVENRNILLPDDMIDTAGTLRTDVEELLTRGAKKIFIAVTHGVLSGDAWQNLTHPQIEKILICNTLEFAVPEQLQKKVEIVSVGKLLADGIQRIHEERSISDLFPERRNAIS
ncbi:MAG TPA: ribose-phosphate pyrophosphokinase [bacterium]|nr:ribose-phosphate pyrophosphokinase [bacterium]HPL95528.1 ribose-phosphate pyrophosphokinase [bacterium]